MLIKQIPAGVGEFAPGPRTHPVTHIVIHRMLGTEAGTDAWFGMPSIKRPGGVCSSANYGISLAGDIHQYVQESDIAYAQGISFHGDAGPAKCLKDNPWVNPNAYCLSIEHEGYSNDAWPEAMLAVSAWLIADIAKRWGITLDSDHVIGHGAIYLPKAATCPGPTCPIADLITRAQAIIL